VSVDAAGQDQQAVRADLLLPGHGPADLRYPAVSHPDIGDLLATRGDDGPAADDKLVLLDSHIGILARGQPSMTSVIGRR